MLDLNVELAEIASNLVDIPSESGQEAGIVDSIEGALARSPHLRLTRDGNSLVARTEFGCADRVLICGHVDTVPAAHNLPHVREMVDGQDRIVGLGACDMKGGVAVMLALAARVSRATRDVTYVFYECEEVDERRNGLKRITETQPELVVGDFAILMEPTDAGIEAGCQGTLRAEVHVAGRRSHSARSWLGRNAIHGASEVLARLAGYTAARVTIDDLEYREGLNAVGVSGGVAGNVIPDECIVTVNYRFAPSMSPELAIRHVRAVFDGFDLRIVDVAGGAMPGLRLPAVASFVAATGGQPRPKFGWTDVARFSALGIPAVNFGPGDPALAHTREEYVPVEQLESVFTVMSDWLNAPVAAPDPWTVP
jgi:succinyl-diaminopimelate desuccinylase